MINDILITGIAIIIGGILMSLVHLNQIREVEKWMDGKYQHVFC